MSLYISWCKDELASDLAQEFLRYPKVGSNHILRYPLLYLWVLLPESEVPLLCRQAETANNAFFRRYIGLLNDDPEEPLQLRDEHIKLLQLLIGKLQ